MTQDSETESGSSYREAKANEAAAKARAKALRPWYRKKRFILGISLLAFVLLAIIAGATAPESTPPAPSSALTTSSGRQTGTPLAGIGQPINLSRNKWEITVTGVERKASLPGILEVKQALGIYIAVSLTLKNIGIEPQALGGDRFTVVDDKGRTYRYYLEGTVGNGQKELGSKIGPGLQGQAVIVFDVPPDATGLVLQTVGEGRIRLDQ
jgi:hypothetical protein